MIEILLGQSLLLILASALMVGLFSASRMPAATGYLLAGIAIGPHALGLMETGEGARFLAELGPVFLMFMVGLEFSLPTLIAARTDVLVAGGIQVSATVAVVAGALWLLGYDPWLGFLLGGAVAMSSTAVTVKQLGEQGEISSPHGRLAIGILLFQDLATIPFLVMVGAGSARGQVDLLDLGRQLAIAGFALVSVALISRPIVRVLFSRVAKSRSNELFLLSVFLVALGAAYLGHLAGLAMPIGAFIAGMVIGESDFRHRVEDDIRPFRDVLVGLFFVTVGTEIDLAVVVALPLAVLIWSLVFLFGKAAITLVVGLLLRRTLATSLRIALILAHGGEFGLLLLTLAMSSALMPAEIGQPVLIALALTMGLAPLIIQHNAIADRLAGSRRNRGSAAEAISKTASTLDGHVLLCGCGRIGRLVATALEAAKLPYVAIEYDLSHFREAQRQGHNVVHGDASHRRILAAVRIAQARLVVITFDRRPAIERILAFAREQNSAAASIVSAADDRDIASLVEAGATIVFPENLAAGLGLADQSLLLCGLSQDAAARIITTLRAELNPELRENAGV